jgi:hypothetical protein
MKKLKKDELYKNLNAFLKIKGIELTDGTYAQRIRQGCSILSDTINFAQHTVDRAKTGMDRKLDKMRQIIHEKTAPKAQPQPSPGPSPTKARRKPAPRKARPQKQAPGKAPSAPAKPSAAKAGPVLGEEQN